VPEECRRARAERKLMAKFGDGWQHFRGRMLLSSVCRAARFALASSLGLCAACGASGLDWVSEPHLESMSAQRSTVVASNVVRATPASIPATAEQGVIEPRPRLNHTVTLGEIEAVATAPPAGQAVAGPSVIVNNYNQVNVVTPAFGYGNYGYSQPGHGRAGHGPGRVTPYGSQSAASGPLPGQNWPSVADYGPSFPYATLPASPWTRTP